jgi:hypothetical protein
MMSQFPEERSVLEMMASVVPVAEIEDDTITALGSAFFISNLGLLITARHVVDEAIRKDRPEGRSAGRPGHHYVIVVPRNSSDTPLEVIGLPVQQIGFDSTTSDVAVLRVDMNQFPDDLLPHLRPWPLAHVRPEPGEECTIYGYGAMLVGEPIDVSDVTRINWMQQLDTSRGPVGDVFPGGRDSGLAPHPCFEVRTVVRGGMSGGPAFTNRGLCGVFSAGDITGFPYALVSYIATCYYLRVDCDLGNGLQEVRITDLVGGRHVEARGDDFEMRSEDGRYKIQWS